MKPFFWMAVSGTGDFCFEDRTKRRVDTLRLDLFLSRKVSDDQIEGESMWKLLRRYGDVK